MVEFPWIYPQCLKGLCMYVNNYLILNFQGMEFIVLNLSMSLVASLSNDAIIRSNILPKHFYQPFLPCNQPIKPKNKILHSKYTFASQCIGNMPICSQRGLLVFKLCFFKFNYSNHSNQISIISIISTYIFYI